MVVLLVAGFFRLWRLDALPPGLFVDVAQNGLDARDVLAGHIQVFFPRNFGREALFIYLQTVLLAAAGFYPFVFKFTSTIVGLLAVAFSYRLFKELFGWATALIAAGLLAVAFWPVDMSRMGLRGTSVPAFAAATLLFLLWTVRRGRRRDALLAGAALGLSLYTYIAARMLPLLVVLLCLAELPAARRRWRELLLAGIVATVVFLPEGVYFFRHREELLGRAADVSVFNPNPEIEGSRDTPLESVVNTAGMFFVRGDENQRHTSDQYRPIFEPPMAVLFVVGLAMALWRARREAAYRWPLLWLLVMCLPGALSHESPNTFRTLGAAPAAFLFPALPVGELVARWRRIGALAAAALLVGYGVWSYRLYFDVWANDPRTYWAYDGNSTRIVDFLRGRSEPSWYISLDRRPTVELLVPRSVEQGRWYREESFGIPIPANADGDVLYLSAPTAALAQAAPAVLPGLVTLPHTTAPGGKADYHAFVWPRAAQTELLGTRRPAAADMAPDFRLVGYRVGAAGEERYVDLFWQPLQPSGPYDLYVHLLGPGDAQVGQSDRLVWPTDEGGPREELILTRQAFKVPAGGYTAEVGAVHRSREDRAQLLGGPIGDVARIPIAFQ